jgi:hypothetical protein
MTESHDKPWRVLALPIYVTALALATFTTFDLALNVWPWNVGAVMWRFGAIGLFASGLLTPLLGLTLAVATAVALQHRTAALVLAILCTLLALVIVPTVPAYVLDAMQVTSRVGVESRRQFTAYWLLALFKLVVLCIAAVVLAMTAFRARRTAPGETKTAKAPRADPRLVAKPRGEKSANLPGPLAEAVDTIESDLRTKPRYTPAASKAQRG